MYLILFQVIKYQLTSKKVYNNQSLFKIKFKDTLFQNMNKLKCALMRIKILINNFIKHPLVLIKFNQKKDN